MHTSILAKLVSHPAFASRRTTAILLPYGTAVVAVGVALGAALLLRKYGLPHPFLSFSLAAIAIAFWYGGTGPGVLAAVLSYATLTVFFVPIKVRSPFSESYLIIYGILALFLSKFSSSRRRAEQLLIDARDNLEMRVAERTTTQRGLAEHKERVIRAHRESDSRKIVSRG